MTLLFYSWGNELLELPIHEIHVVNNLNGERLEILLNESKNDDWIYIFLFNKLMKKGL